MAAACGLKRTQFEILTKELTGDAPLILLNRFRVRLAQSSLTESDETITDIAFNTGFGSSQYFSQVFKCVAGMTPSEYRRQRGNLAAYDQRFREVLAELKSRTSPEPAEPYEPAEFCPRPHVKEYQAQN
jgi:AraC-like DNA-binding protein